MRIPLTKLENIVLIIITIPLTISPLCLLFLVRLGGYTVNLYSFYFYKTHRETDRFFAASGVQLVESDRDQFHYKLVVFSSQFKSKVDNILFKVPTLRITLNIDGTRPDHTLTLHTLKLLVY